MSVRQIEGLDYRAIPNYGKRDCCFCGSKDCRCEVVLVSKHLRHSGAALCGSCWEHSSTESMFSAATLAATCDPEEFPSLLAARKPERIVIRCSSRKAIDRLESALGRYPLALFSFEKGSGFYEIDAGEWCKLFNPHTKKRIPGITKSRVKREQLSRCWG